MEENARQQVEPALVAALYVEHSEELKRFLTGVLRDAALAADAMQAAFVAMVERGHEVEQESHKAWLFRVAYHQALALRRRQAVGDRAVQQKAYENQILDSSAAEALACDAPLLRGEQVEAVRAALAELPWEQQQVVRMRIYEEKKFSQIAAELNIPLGTALGRMRTALSKLRARLDPNDL
ncbi:RNA polymerase sigma factor [Lignipirellula cremea]|uniref:RNA polymerase sigma factor n=1 Tax=Lignipirellula cremea TaxID=2528010 RepID=A0A518DZU8_9BACT|nr:sigma-70 family RNA polymerase sigma factor [Lignipirellula cremea]QDU97345.1 RNA polymerase sigma factor [Lignipirellula cremea]